MAKKEIEAKTRRSFPACCDIYEEDGNVVLRLQMPGVTKDKLNININGNELTIRGKRTSLKQEGKYLIREIPDGDFFQKYTIDDTIDRNKIDASLKNGILTITLSIKESEKPRKIDVVAK
jgi:HSP20 family protein